jgi:putative membrane protein
MSSQLLLHEAAGWHWWFAPFWFLLWVVVIVTIVRFAPWRRRYDRRVDARAILAERYARGEIDAEEYAARRDVLSQ